MAKEHFAEDPVERPVDFLAEFRAKIAETEVSSALFGALVICTNGAGYDIYEPKLALTRSAVGV